MKTLLLVSLTLISLLILVSGCSENWTKNKSSDNINLTVIGETRDITLYSYVDKNTDCIIVYSYGRVAIDCKGDKE